MKINGLIICLFLLVNSIFSQDCPTVIISEAEGMPGDTVCVEIALANIEQFNSCQGTISYDKSILNFVGYEEISEQIPDDYFQFNEPFDDGQIIILGISFGTTQVNYQFIQPEPIVSMCFVLNGTSGTSSSVSLTSDLRAIQFASSGENGFPTPINICNIINGSIGISDGPNNENFEVVTNIENIPCGASSGGTITASGVFGTPPYTFVWSGPNGFNSTDAEITNLSPGSYNVTATDANGNNAVRENVTLDITGQNEIILESLENNLCLGGAAGSINISGNTALNSVVTFEWSNAANTEDISNLAAGIYNVTMTDENGCTNTAEYEITESERIISAITTKSFIQCDQGTARIIVGTTQNAVGPFTYLWSNGDTDRWSNGLSAGTYSVTVTDANGCIDTETYVVESLDLLANASLSATCSAAGESNGSFNISGISSIVTYDVDWNNGSESGQALVNLSPGTYSVTINTGACIGVYEIVIEESLSAYQENYNTCNLDSIQVMTSSNNNTLSYSWTPANKFDQATAPNPYYLTTAMPDSSDLFFALTTTGEQGCTRDFTFDLNLVNSCVWPGDVIGDRTVSAIDLLPIGIANGTTGPARANASSDWSAQPADEWLILVNGFDIDMMHTDCNGDGVVNADDILVVTQNTGLTHAGFVPVEDLDRAVGVPIYIDLSSGFGGDVFVPADIILGTEAEPVANVYGISFQIKYNPIEVEVDEFDGIYENGWLSADNSEVWDVDFIDNKNGLVDVAITRTDGKNISGYGSIASFFPYPSVAPNDSFQMEIINPFLISFEGESIEIEGQMTTGFVYPTGVSYLDGSLFKEKVYPNPVASILSVDSERVIDRITVYNVLGERIIDADFSSNINIGLLDSGLYFIQLWGEDGLTRHSFVKE